MKRILFDCLFVLIIFPALFAVVGSAQTPPSEMEQAILNELNTVRANPTSYIAHLEEYKKLFNGKNVNEKGQIFQTDEGVSAVDGAIKFLKKASKLEPFKLSTGLSKSAQLQLDDLKEDISLGLTGKDRSTVPQRAARFGKGGKLYAANISFYFTTARDIVMHMIIDDGIKGRGNRQNIFNKTLQYIGIAFGKGKNDDPISFLVFADKFVESTN